MLARNGTRPGEQFVEDHAKAVNVSAPVDAMRSPHCLFRGHVEGSTRDKPLFSAACLILGKRQPKINQYRHPIGRENDVVRFDVAMND